jgi:hypothetical protein
LRAQLDGFDLHAALTVQAQPQEGRLPLEKLLRYCARPPIAEERLQALEDGRIALRLKTPWHDGTTHVLFEPIDFVAKLAAFQFRKCANVHGRSCRKVVGRYGGHSAERKDRGPSSRTVESVIYVVSGSAHALG